MDYADRNRIKENYGVTFVISTAEILPHLLSALNRQTYRNFDVVIVVKSSGDGTEEILKQASIQTAAVKSAVQPNES